MHWNWISCYSCRALWLKVEVRVFEILRGCECQWSGDFGVEDLPIDAQLSRKKGSDKAPVATLNRSLNSNLNFQLISTFHLQNFEIILSNYSTEISDNYSRLQCSTKTDYSIIFKITFPIITSMAIEINLKCFRFGDSNNFRKNCVQRGRLVSIFTFLVWGEFNFVSARRPKQKLIWIFFNYKKFFLRTIHEVFWINEPENCFEMTGFWILGFI